MKAAGPAPARTRHGPGSVLVLVLGVGAVLRGAALATVGDPPALQGDEIYYVSAALSLARGQGFPDSARPPGLPFLLSMAFRWGGETLLAARLAQTAVSLLGVAFVFDLVRRRFGIRPAFLSGLVCAIHPTLVHYSHFLWAETLYATLLLAVFWSLDRFEQSRSAAWVPAAGLGLGLAALTREMALYFLPFVLLWLWLVPADALRAKLLRLGLAILSCALVVAPWAARNQARHGRFVLISTTRWLPMAQGNLLPDSDWIFGPMSDPGLVGRYFAIPDELEREHLARDVAARAIARQQPLWVIRKMVRNTFLLFRPVSQLSKFLDAGWLRPESAPLARWLVRAEWVGYGLLTAVGLAGFWLVPHGRTKWVIAGYVAFSWALYVVANANHRFRVPLLPLLAIYTGPLLCGQVAVGRSRRWRVLGTVLCLAVFLAVVAMDAHGRRFGFEDAQASVSGGPKTKAAPARSRQRRQAGGTASLPVVRYGSGPMYV